jgi:RHS repeat-associated protein
MVAMVSNGTATYTYDAAGNKLRKVSVISGVTTTTEYISGIQYKNSTTAVDFIQTEEGKAVNNSGSYDYNYYLGDNLGNTRVTFGTKTGTAVQYQRDDYYPFGLELSRSVTSPKNEYLYNKKELQEEFTEYDYGARFYDPVIARWNMVDPMAEEDRRTTPYSYTFDDPIRHTDPDGMFGEDANDCGCPNPPCGVSSQAKVVLGTGLMIAGGEIAVAAPTGVGEVVAVPAAVVTTGITLIAAGGVLLFHVIFDSHSSTAPQSTPPTTTQPTTKPAAQPTNLQTKEVKRADAEHTSGARPSTLPKHEAAQSRKQREQAKADQKYSKTKSTKEAEKSNNQKKREDPNYKKTDDPKKSVD